MVLALCTSMGWPEAVAIGVGSLAAAAVICGFWWMLTK